MWRLMLIGLVGCGENTEPGPSPGQTGDDCDHVEIPYDGVDQDCSGADLTDRDEDGHDAMEAGGGDCDDGDSAIHPDAEDLPYDDIDQDCSGADLTDLDQDGYGSSDCDDADPLVHPDAVEVWYDGIDQNCLEDCDYDADHDQAIPVEWHAEITDGSVCDRDPSAGASAPPDCDDADPQASTQQIESIWPTDGATEVPPHTQVEVYFRDKESVEVHLFDPEGNEIAADSIQEVGQTLGVILFPHQPLASATTYTVESTHSCGISTSTFTTE